VDVDVNDLFRIIGEQHVQILLLQRDQQSASEEQQPADLHPMSERKLTEIREAAE
jgi:hypothetical protein